MNVRETYYNIITGKIDSRAKEAAIMSEDKEMAAKAFEAAREDWFQAPATQFILARIREEQMSLLMRLEDKRVRLSEVETQSMLAEYFTLVRVLRFAATGKFDKM